MLLVCLENGWPMTVSIRITIADFSNQIDLIMLLKETKVYRDLWKGICWYLGCVCDASWDCLQSLLLFI